MKKILAIMLIAVIAVAGVFATMTGYGEGTSNDVKLKYTVLDTFTPKYGFKVTVGNGTAQGYEGTAIETRTASDKGQIVAGNVTIDIYDMSYCNSGVQKSSTVKLTMPSKWVDAAGDDTDADFSVLTNMALDTYADTDANSNDRFTTTSLSGTTITVAYDLNKIVDRASETKAVKVGSVSYQWDADTEVVTGAATATVEVEIGTV